MKLDHNRLGVILGSAHLVYSLACCCVALFYILVEGSNKHGIVSTPLLIMSVILIYTDFPVAYIIELFGKHISSGPAGVLIYFGVYAIGGTSMWFLVGIIIQRILALRRRASQWHRAKP